MEGKYCPDPDEAWELSYSFDTTTLYVNSKFDPDAHQRSHEPDTPEQPELQTMLSFHLAPVFRS